MDRTNGLSNIGRQDDTPKSMIDLQQIGLTLDKLSKASIHSIDSSSSFSGVGSFPEWINSAAKVQDPNAARTVIYNGFQPLYDALVDRKLPTAQRGIAVQTLNCTIP